MVHVKKIVKIIIWAVFFSSSVLGLLRIINNIFPESLAIESAKMVTAFYWSGLLLVEIILAICAIYFFIKNPFRRIRLVTLSVCHFAVILALPLAFHDWTYTAILYPWPHTLQAFDPKTSQTIMLMSILVGFVIIPLITYKWGRRAFCGYICPHGAFISETYGRLFNQYPNRLKILKKFVPKIYFLLMLIALLIILIMPEAFITIRCWQKIVFLITAELLYFVFLVPFVGGRSYCSLICPLGYAIKCISQLKKNDTRKYHNLSIPKTG